MSMLFPVKYGAAIAGDVGRILSPAIVVTQPEPWEALRARFGGTPAALVMADSLERAHLKLFQIPSRTALMASGT
jgi:hypothetical protein